MYKPTVPQNTPEKNAQKYFTKTEQNETLEKKARKKERAATAAKTERLRDLRLAKEVADKAEADRLAAEKAENPGAAKRTARRPAQKKRPALRMIY